MAVAGSALTEECVSVTDWRRTCLRAAGCDVVVTEILAELHDIDLHLALSMLSAGCSPRLLLEILA